MGTEVVVAEIEPEPTAKRLSFSVSARGKKSVIQAVALLRRYAAWVGSCLVESSDPRRRFFLECLIFEAESCILSRNVCICLHIVARRHLRRSKASLTAQWKLKSRTTLATNCKYIETKFAQVRANRSFRMSTLLNYPKNVGSKILRNIDIYIKIFTGSFSRRMESLPSTYCLL